MRCFNKLCALLMLGGIGQGAPAQLGEEPLMTSYTLPEDSKTTVSIENGAALYHAMGCVTCHAISGSQEEKDWSDLTGGLRGKTGPSWMAASQWLMTNTCANPSYTRPGGHCGDSIWKISTCRPTTNC